jgi:cytochrome c-type biogenesis protein CcmE
VLAVLVGAFGFLAVEGLGGSLDYFRTVDQAVAARTTIGDQEFRLEGTVVPGSITTMPGGVRFVAAGKDAQVAVVNHGAPPQLFCPGRQVVVDGRFAGRSGGLPLFDSHQLIVDHTQYYVAAHPGRVAEPPCPGLGAAEQHP